MGKNIRFLKTKVDNDNIYMIMHKCNFCPFLMVDKENYKGICGNPKKNKLIDNIVKDDIMYYEHVNGKISVLDTCDIPDFCYLSKNLKEEFEKEELTYKKNEAIYVLKSPRKGDEKILSEIYICSTETSEFTYTEKFEKFKEAKKKYNERKNNTTINILNNVLEETRIEQATSLPEHTNVITYEVCSCCGEIKEEVNRIVNNGMCNQCYEFTKTDFNLIRNSMINNFRLKRNKNFIEKDFKKIEKYFEF